jgi:hypothetical protein
MFEVGAIRGATSWGWGTIEASSSRKSVVDVSGVGARKVGAGASTDAGKEVKPVQSEYGRRVGIEIDRGDHTVSLSNGGARSRLVMGQVRASGSCNVKR